MALRFSKSSTEKNISPQLIGDDILFKKLIENSYSGIALLDSSFKVIYRSPSAQRISGWDTAKITQSTLAEFIHPADIGAVKDVFKQVIASPGIPKTCKFRSRHLNGNYIWLQCTFTNMLSDGDIKAIVCNFIDITDQKKSEELLQQTINELSAYKYALDEAAIVAITDQKGIIKHVNDNFCKISKYSRDELIGQDHRIINSSYHSKDFIKNLWTSIANGKVWRGELRNKAKDGNYYWVDTTIVPFLDGIGKPYQYVAIRSDVTERKLTEEKMITLLENINDGFIALDENMCYTYANKRVGDMIGRDPETLIGKNIWEIFPDAVGSLTWQAIQSAVSEKRYVCNEDYYEPLDIWQENRVYPSGNGISMFIRDITQKKQEERQLRLLESVITNTTDAVLITEIEPLDEPGPRIIYVNEAFTKMTGYTAGEVIGKTPRILQGPKTDKAELKRLSKAMRNFQPCEITVINYKKSGEEFWINFSVSPVADDKGNYTHLIAIEKDITAQKVSEIKLKELNQSLFKQTKELAISNAELEQFAYVASHDLQEPLRMVTSFLTQIEKKYADILDDKGLQYINFAVDGAKRMRQIILDLLEFSRVGRADDSSGEVDLNKIVAEILALYRKKIEEQKAVIKYDDLPVIHTLMVPIRQVFQNLISNSLKYQPKNQVPVISISCEEFPDFWQCCVKDNGIGIEAEYFDKIFIIFQRLHNKEEYSGTGMGLAVTKKIIENLGGKIWLESEEGKGSAFYFTILKT